MKRVDVASALIFDSSREKVLLVRNKKGETTYWSPPGGAVFTFLARIIDGEIQIMDPDNEIVEVKWVDIQTANKLMPFIPDIDGKLEKNSVDAVYIYEGTK